MSNYKDRAFRGWVSGSTAEDRAFAGWVVEGEPVEVNHVVIASSLAAPTCVMAATVSVSAPRYRHHRQYILGRRIEASIAASIAAPTCEMRVAVIDWNYVTAMAELDADVAEILMMEVTRG